MTSTIFPAPEAKPASEPSKPTSEVSSSEVDAKQDKEAGVVRSSSSGKGGPENEFASTTASAAAKIESAPASSSSADEDSEQDIKKKKKQQNKIRWKRWWEKNRESYNEKRRLSSKKAAAQEADGDSDGYGGKRVHTASSEDGGPVDEGDFGDADRVYYMADALRRQSLRGSDLSFSGSEGSLEQQQFGASSAFNSFNPSMLSFPPFVNTSPVGYRSVPTSPVHPRQQPAPQRQQYRILRHPASARQLFPSAAIAPHRMQQAHGRLPMARGDPNSASLPQLSTMSMFAPLPTMPRSSSFPRHQQQQQSSDGFNYLMQQQQQQRKTSSSSSSMDLSPSLAYPHQQQQQQREGYIQRGNQQMPSMVFGSSQNQSVATPSPSPTQQQHVQQFLQGGHYVGSSGSWNAAANALLQAFPDSSSALQQQVQRGMAMPNPYLMSSAASFEATTQQARGSPSF
jgi:hypothetical protein